MFKKEFPVIFVKNVPKESYFLLLFNTLSYFLAVPFRVRENTDGEYILVTGRFQKLGCAFIHFCAILSSLRYTIMYTTYASPVPANINALFTAVGNVASSLSVIALIKVLWLDQSGILEFLKVSRVEQRLYYKIKEGDLKVIPLCIYTILSYLIFSLNTSALTRMSDLTTGIILNWLQGHLFGPLCSPSLTFKLFQIVSGTLYFIGCGVIFLANCMFSITRLFVMVYFLKLQAFGLKFERFLKDDPETDFVIREFDKLRNAVEIGNGWSHQLILIHYVGVLAFLACVPALNESREKVVVAYLIYSYIIFGAFIIIACDLPSRVRNSLKKWMVKKRQRFAWLEERLLIIQLTQDIDGDPVAVSCQFFSITYSLLGTMAGLVVTYGLLVYQMQVGEQFKGRNWTTNH